MSVQFPVLSDQQQKERYSEIASKTLYPYSYSGFLSGATDFPTADPSVTNTFKYNTIAFQADNNMGISAIQVVYSARIGFDAISGGGASSSTFAMAISYSPVFNLITTPDPAGAFPVPTVPGDIGNQILRLTQIVVNPLTTANFQFANNNVYERFEPYNYILKYNQFLYIQLGFDTSTLGASLASFIYFTVILHTLPTGLKT